jgi:FtsZ-binding cell division protein ZapB
MAIDSCDHGDFVVAYEVVRTNKCPVCELIEENKDLKQQVVSAQGDIENLEDEIASLQNEIG